MSTGNKKVNIYLKKFLTQQHMTENFLDYLHNLIIENHMKLVPAAGLYSYPVTMRSDTVDKISFLTPGEATVGDGNGPSLEGDDGHGRIILLDNTEREDVPVPNTLGTKYYCGIRFNYYPYGTEINVRTGVIKWSLFEEAVGERAEPNHASYYNGLLQFQIDSISSGVLQSGRTARVWLKTPVSEATGDVYEDAAVTEQVITLEHDGGNAFLDVPNGFAGYFQTGQSLTVDRVPTAPITVTVNSIGLADTGGVGFTRIQVSSDLTGYTVAASSFVKTGNNIATLTGTLGQGLTPSVVATDYETFLYGLTVSSSDLRNDEYYAYLGNYTGTGAGNNPGSFDISDQVMVPENLSSIVGVLQDFKQYQIQRNAVTLRGGGQFKFEGGTLDWNEAFEIVNPFRAIYSIAASSLASIVTNDVVYIKIVKEQKVIIAGTAIGEIWIESNSGLSPGDSVTIGDSDSTRLTGTVDSISGSEKVVLTGAPDLTGFTPSKGGWLQKTNVTLQKDQVNTGDLRPDSYGDMNTDVMVLAVCHNGVLIFKNGVLKLEDGDIGEISNLPAGYNWINNIGELVDSITRAVDGSVGILAPRTYTATSQIAFNKNLNWYGISPLTIITGALATSLLKITYDPTTTGSYMSVSLGNLNLVNTGAGDVLEIDNTGAAKGIEVVLDVCNIQASNGLAVKVVHGEPTQWIRFKWVNGNKQTVLGSITFESEHAGDELRIYDVQFNAGESITFGKTAADPASLMEIRNVMIDRIDAIGAGTNKIIDIQDCYSWDDNKRIDLNGRSNATFKVSQVIVNERDFENYQKADNGTIFRGGEEMTFLSGVLTWATDFELVDPFYGIGIITAASLSGIANNDILYTKWYKPQIASTDGNASGEIEVEDASDFNDDDVVILGDSDSTVIQGYVQGAPVGGVITVDDGAGTPIDISTITKANGGWIRRLNLALVKGTVNTADLKPDYLGDLDPQVYVIAVCHNGRLVFKNGTIIEKIWIYEETFIAETDIDVDEEIQLPLDSRHGFIQKTYRNGAGHVSMYLNGVLAHRDKVILEDTFDPTTYTSGTGIVTCPDAADLSNLERGDWFVDEAGNEFMVEGNVDNTLGQKQFKIATGQTVSQLDGASLYRRHYAEYGNADQWVDRVVNKMLIKAKTMITFRVLPIDRIGGSSGGGGPGLGDVVAVNPNATIISGNPITISGPAGQKLLRILGDMECTGVIDPKAITFSRSVARPWSSALDGFWVNEAGQVNWYNKVSESDEIVGGSADVLQRSYTYTQPGQLISGTPVIKAGATSINFADWGTQANASIVGILIETLNQNDSGKVRFSGYIDPSIFSVANFFEGLLPADGSWIWLHASGKMTVTPPVEKSGKWQVILGIWENGGFILRPIFLGVA